MKIRNGFVSNSSSTSFVLFIENPEREKIKNHFFPDKDWTTELTDDLAIELDGTFRSFTVDEIVESIVNNMEEIDEERFRTLIYERVYHEMMEYDYYLEHVFSDSKFYFLTTELRNYLEDKAELEKSYGWNTADRKLEDKYDEDKLIKEAVEKYVNSAFKKCYEVEYGDDNLFGRFMENGPVFNEDNSLIISNH